MPRRGGLPALRRAAQECRGCDLHEHATQAVVGVGPRDADLMLVGEQPGDQEDLAGEPFVGPAGKLLDRALDAAGLDPDLVFRTNAVKHFRWEGTRGKQRLHKGPSRLQVAACGPWLVAELRLVSPRGVVLLGSTVGQAVYGAGFRITRERGRVLDWPSAWGGLAEPPAWSLPTVHPSSVLRSRDRDTDFELLVSDLAVAADALARGGVGNERPATQDGRTATPIEEA